MIPLTNYTQGREGNPVTLVVIHWIGEGDADAASAHFQNPASRVSAHYLVRRDGRIEALVPEADTAYHAGDFNVNLLSIGIEHEVTPTLPPTDELYAASGRLLRQIANRYGIDLQVGVTLLPHNKVVPTKCPGTLDLERLVHEANGPDRAEYARITEPLVKETLKVMLRDDAETRAIVREIIAEAVSQ